MNLEYRVEEDLYIRGVNAKFKITWYNEHYDLWLSVDSARYPSIEEATKIMKSRYLVEKKVKRAIPKKVVNKESSPS